MADDWVGITPGTDGLLIMSLIHALMKTGQIDLIIKCVTPMPHVVIRNPDKTDDGLFLRDQ